MIRIINCDTDKATLLMISRNKIKNENKTGTNKTAVLTSIKKQKADTYVLLKHNSRKITGRNENTTLQKIFKAQNLKN